MLSAFAYHDKQNFQIAKVIYFIQLFTENLEISALAAKTIKSQSSFHWYIKFVTNCSPIQYIEAIRLHAARTNILFDNHSVSDAAYNIGYSSSSQFCREYRRFLVFHHQRMYRPMQWLYWQLTCNFRNLYE